MPNDALSILVSYYTSIFTLSLACHLLWKIVMLATDSDICPEWKRLKRCDRWWRCALFPFCSASRLSTSSPTTARKPFSPLCLSRLPWPPECCFCKGKKPQNIMECKTLNQTFEESEDLINLSFPNITITDFQAQKRPSPALFGWGQQKLCSQLELKWLLNRESQSLI